MNEDKLLHGLSDEQLMQRYRIGEMEAFQELHNRHAAKVYGFLSKKLSSTSHADDVFQETFLRLHRFRNKYDSSFPFLPWLFTLCRNAMLDSLRKRQARDKREVSLEETVEAANPGISWELEPQPAALRSYLDSLSEREREVLTLHLEGGYSFKEVGVRLRITPANARKLSSRAIQKLKTLWK